MRFDHDDSNASSSRLLLYVSKLDTLSPVLLVLGHPSQHNAVSTAAPRLKGRLLYVGRAKGLFLTAGACVPESGHRSGKINPASALADKLLFRLFQECAENIAAGLAVQNHKALGAFCP